MSSLGYLIQAKPPLNHGLMVRLTVNHFYHPFEVKVQFLEVTRVITLAPHEVHPYHSTERRYLPSWR